MLTALVYKQDFCFVDPANPGRFSTSRSEHFQWCMKEANQTGLDNERANRDMGLNHCQRKKDGGAGCRAYAKDAVEIATEFKENNCFEDPALDVRFGSKADNLCGTKSRPLHPA